MISMTLWRPSADIGPLDPLRWRDHRRSTDRFLGWAVLGFLLGGALVFAALNRDAVLATLDDIIVQANEWSVPADAQPLAIQMPICGRGFDISCVIDGDTIRLQGERIRLSTIDAPELLAPSCESERLLAARSRDRLAEVLSSRPWRVVRDGSDHYGRTLAQLRLENGWVGTVLVREGLAHWYESRWLGWC